MYKFVNLITSDNIRTITNFAIYLNKAFKIRNNEMFAETQLVIYKQNDRYFEYLQVITSLSPLSRLLTLFFFIFSNISASLSINMFQYTQII